MKKLIITVISLLLVSSFAVANELSIDIWEVLDSSGNRIKAVEGNMLTTYACEHFVNGESMEVSTDLQGGYVQYQLADTGDYGFGVLGVSKHATFGGLILADHLEDDEVALIVQKRTLVRDGERCHPGTNGEVDSDCWLSKLEDIEEVRFKLDEKAEYIFEGEAVINGEKIINTISCRSVKINFTEVN